MATKTKPMSKIAANVNPFIFTVFFITYCLFGNCYHGLCRNPAFDSVKSTKWTNSSVCINALYLYDSILNILLLLRFNSTTFNGRNNCECKMQNRIFFCRNQHSIFKIVCMIDRRPMKFRIQFSSVKVAG